MKTTHENHRQIAPASDVLAIHLLKAMSTHHLEGRRTTLDDLSLELGIRREDVRRVMSALHREGYVDVLAMRPTLAGLAIGSSLRDEDLVPARVRSDAARQAA
jgi:transcription initiation factor IIE alpha subunit